MKPWCGWCVIVVMALAVNAVADPVTLTADNAMSTSSFNSALSWSDGQAPHDDADYLVTGGRTLRTPEGGASYVFEGRSLTFDNGNVNLKGTGTVTVHDLRLYTGRFANGINGTTTLAGTVTVFQASTPFRFSGSQNRTTRLTATLLGNGDLSVDRTENETTGTFVCELHGDNADFAGGLRVVGASIEARAAHTNALGGGALPTFRADALRLKSGGAFSVSLDYVWNEPTRGITFEGGGILKTVSDATLTVAGPMTGTGDVTISASSGRVVFGARADVDGDILVAAGTLRVIDGFTLRDGQEVVMRAGARRLEGYAPVDRVTMQGGVINPGTGTEVTNLTVGVLTFNGGGLEIDLDAATGTADFVTVTGQVVKLSGAPIPITINGYGMDVPHDWPLLSAPNLRDLAADDFALTGVYGLPNGELVFEDVDDSTVLIFRARPVVRLLSSDSSADAGNFFSLGTRWSNGLVPAPENDYLIDSGLVLRTQSDGTVTQTFQGNSLTIAAGADLRVKCLRTEVNDLRVYGAAKITQGTPPETQYLAGNLFVAETSSPFSFEIEGASAYQRALVIESTVSGRGGLRFQPYVTTSSAYGGVFKLVGNNAAYTGPITVNGTKAVELVVTNEVNLGGNPESFNAAQLTLTAGGVLHAETSLVLDDSNRGITLSQRGGLRAEKGVTLTVAVPITGAELVKSGAGTVVLNVANSHSGGTTVAAGALEVRHEDALGSGGLSFAEGAVLRIPHDAAALPLGVRVYSANAVTVAEGTACVVEPVFDGAIPKAFDLPLFLLMEEQAALPEIVIQGVTPNHKVEILTRTVNDSGTEQTQVYARVRWAGLVFFLQ